MAMTEEENKKMLEALKTLAFGGKETKTVIHPALLCPFQADNTKNAAKPTKADYLNNFILLTPFPDFDALKDRFIKISPIKFKNYFGDELKGEDLKKAQQSKRCYFDLFTNEHENVKCNEKDDNEQKEII